MLDEPKEVISNKWLDGLDQHRGTCLRGLETPGKSIQKGSLPKPSYHLLLSEERAMHSLSCSRAREFARAALTTTDQGQTAQGMLQQRTADDDGESDITPCAAYYFVASSDLLRILMQTPYKELQNRCYLWINSRNCKVASTWEAEERDL